MSVDVMPRQEETSTRREIINLLRVVGPLTVGELGERLHITHVAVRRHLTSLERDGLVTSVQQRLPMGRPTRVYSLTEAADNLFPKKYGAMMVELLDFMHDTDPALVEDFFRRRGEELVARYGGDVDGDTLSERVEQLAAIVDELSGNGLGVRYETSDDPAYLVDNPSRRSPDLTKLRAAIDWKPRVSLREGIARTLAAHREGT